MSGREFQHAGSDNNSISLGSRRSGKHPFESIVPCFRSRSSRALAFSPSKPNLHRRRSKIRRSKHFSTLLCPLFANHANAICIGASKITIKYWVYHYLWVDSLFAMFNIVNHLKIHLSHCSTWTKTQSESRRVLCYNLFRWEVSHPMANIGGSNAFFRNKPGLPHPRNQYIRRTKQQIQTKNTYLAMLSE